MRIFNTSSTAAAYAVSSLLLLLLLSGQVGFGVDAQPVGGQQQQPEEAAQHEEGQVPKYLQHVQCSSTQPTYTREVELMPGLTLHYHHVTDHYDGRVFSARLMYSGKAWLGLGFSPTNGTMVGSRAVIGTIPTANIDANPNNAVGKVALYNLKTQQTDASGIVEQKNTNFDKVSMQYQKRHDVTTLTFSTRHFPGLVTGAHDEANPDVITMIFAVGRDTTLGYHKHRGAFRLDVDSCPPERDPLAHTAHASSYSFSDTYDHKAAFAAHGFFATLTFAVVVPFALSAAWFRTLIPKWWIYIHVLSNACAAFFTTIAVATAFGGMIMREKAEELNSSHMSLSHHWVGLFLYLLVLFQVLNGCRRPPVEAKRDPTAVGGGGSSEPDGFDDSSSSQKCCCGFFPSCSTRRGKWHGLHIVTATAIIGMALFQLQSGLDLYTTEYGGNTKAAIIVYWIWVAVLVVFLATMKCCVNTRSQKLRSKAPTNLMPQRNEDDLHRQEYHDEVVPQLQNSSEQESEKFNNII